MKTVVIVAPDFTPSSYPPALRVKFFVQHLEEFGWKPIVLTIESSEYEWPVDHETERLLSPSLQVIRTRTLPHKLTRKIGIGDVSLRSFWSHWRTLVRLCRTQPIDLIFISIPPFYSALLGRLIHRSFGTPYVIDYIDPWVYEDYAKRPRAQRSFKRSVSHAISSFLEPIALKRVKHLVGVSKATTDDVIRRYDWLSGLEAAEIPYGGSISDFNYLRENRRHNRFFSKADDNYNLCYVGRSGTDMKPALTALLAAVKNGLQRDPTTFDRLRLHFIGTTYATKAANQYHVLPIAHEYGLEGRVAEHPERVSYLDALQILLDADGLVLTGSDRPHYTASKIFPYVLAQRPLLALFHEQSTVVRIVRETNCGQVITFESAADVESTIPEITQALETFLKLPQTYEPSTNWTAFDAYSSRSMTARLAQVFDTALSQRDAWRASAEKATASI